MPTQEDSGYPEQECSWALRAEGPLATGFILSS
jgi:hypothetical protein